MVLGNLKPLGNMKRIIVQVYQESVAFTDFHWYSYTDQKEKKIDFRDSIDLHFMILWTRKLKIRD